MIPVKFSPKQTIAWETLQSPDIDIVLYGGSKGGGKSVFGCYWLFLKCLDTISRLKLSQLRYPVPVAFMGRKQSVDFNDTTLETWKKVIPAEYYELRVGEKEIIIRNCLKVQYGGLDDGNTIKKFNSAEYGFIFIDQAEEISQDDFALLRGTQRLRINGHLLDYKFLMTANPAECWLKDAFVHNTYPRAKFIQALPMDNPFLPSTYVDNLRQSFKHRPELVKAYVDGSWDVVSGFDIVIKPSWVTASIDRVLTHLPSKRTVVSCDPARFGDDETVIYVVRENRIIDTMIYGQRDTMETAGHIVSLKYKHKADAIIVDGNGIGAGIVDRLREQQHQVIDYNSSSAPEIEIDHVRFYNLRSQTYWQAGQLFSNELVSIPDDSILRSQLSSVKYKLNSQGKVQIESKDDIKKRNSGKSPDRADALIMGLYAITKIPAVRIDFQRDMVPQRQNDYGWVGVEQYA